LVRSKGSGDQVRVGLHISGKGGTEAAFARATALGIEVMQIFLGNPRSWSASPSYDEERTHRLRVIAEAAQLQWFVHLPYLINVASPEAQQYERSRAALLDYCSTAEALGASGVVLHVGSHRGAGFDAVVESITAALGEVCDALSTCRLLIENAAGQSGAVGSSLDELAQLFERVDDERLALCVDTAHLMGAGIEFRTAESLDAYLSELGECIGLDKLALVHLNDSKRGLGSGRDLHENIGYGTVGVDGFKYLLTHPLLKDVPAVLEVPGLDGDGPDMGNLEIVFAIQRGDVPAIESTAADQLALKL
jgi:deoxyribonuclease-4